MSNHLISLSIGDQSTSFGYSDEGDLVAVNYTNGDKDVYHYDRFNILSGYYTYGPSGVLLTGRSISQDWNGRVTITTWPENRTNELHYDFSGGLVFSRPKTALPLYYHESPKSQRILLGDEVSINTVCELMYQLYVYMSFTGSLNTNTSRFKQYNIN